MASQKHYHILGCTLALIAVVVFLATTSRTNPDRLQDPRPKGGGAGDQLVKIKIVLPSPLTDEERELYERLKALRNDNPRAYLG